MFKKKQQLEPKEPGKPIVESVFDIIKGNDKAKNFLEKQVTRRQFITIYVIAFIILVIWIALTWK